MVSLGVHDYIADLLKGIGFVVSFVRRVFFIFGSYSQQQKEEVDEV